MGSQQDLHPFAFRLRLQESPWAVSLGQWALLCSYHWQKGTLHGAFLRCPEGSGATGLLEIPAELESTVILKSNQTQNSVSICAWCLTLDLSTDLVNAGRLPMESTLVLASGKWVLAGHVGEADAITPTCCAVCTLHALGARHSQASQ